MLILDSKLPAYRQNPYPFLRQLREAAPVCKVMPFNCYAVTRHADIQAILKQPDIFSSADLVNEPPSNRAEFLLYSRGLIGTDKPDHTRLRRLLSKAFTPHTLARLEMKIQHHTERFIAALPRNTAFDFVDSFSARLPMTIMAELIGIDADRIADFKRWVGLLLSWRHHRPATLMQEIESMYQYINLVIHARKQSPRDDLISTLVAACDQEELITDTELLAFIRLLLVAGTETTTNLLGNGLLALLTHPEQLALLRNDLNLLPGFIDEALRYDSPALCLSRRLTQPYELHGVILKKDDIVLPLLASANHDARVFNDPDTFDITRNSKAHLSFGGGIHLCLGSMLAKLQARIGFTEFFKEFKQVKRANEDEIRYLDSFFFRGLRSLPVIAGE